MDLGTFIADRGFFDFDFVMRVDQFIETAPREYNTNDTEPVWYELEQGESRRFMGAAILFALENALDEDVLPSILIPFVRQSREHGW